ncbi:unnamed protein product [Ectocarpus sp. 12 AP-2014]
MIVGMKGAIGNVGVWARGEWGKWEEMARDCWLTEALCDAGYSRS